MSKETYKLKKEVEILKKEVKLLKNNDKQIIKNEARIQKRIEDLESGVSRIQIKDMLMDYSKTGKANYTIEKIAELNGVSENRVRKIAKEEGIKRNTNGDLLVKW